MISVDGNGRDGYGWLEADFGWLAQACCLTLVAGGEEVGVLSRFGAGPGGLVRGPLGEVGMPFPVGAPVAAARQVAGGVLVVEPNGRQGGRAEVLRAVSAGGVAGSMLATVGGNGHVGFGVDGRLAFCALDDAGRVWGVEAGRLGHVVAEVVGRRPVRGGGGRLSVREAVAVAARAAGVMFSAQDVAGVFVGGEVLELLDDLPMSAEKHPLGRQDPVLVRKVVGAEPALTRAVAVEQARQLAEQSGLGGEAVVVEALAAAERGQARLVGNTEPLGLLVRRLGARSWAASTAGSAGGMSGADVQAALAGFRAGRAVIAALAPQPQVALLEVCSLLRPDPPGAAWRQAVLAALAS